MAWVSWWRTIAFGKQMLEELYPSVNIGRIRSEYSTTIPVI